MIQAWATVESGARYREDWDCCAGYVWTYILWAMAISMSSEGFKHSFMNKILSLFHANCECADHVFERE